MPSSQFLSGLSRSFGAASNATINVLVNSKLHVVCPNTATVMTKTRATAHKGQLFENFWFVSRKSYESCTVETGNGMDCLVATCDAPLELKYYTLVFQSHSADPNELLFTPGQEYFFLGMY